MRDCTEMRSQHPPLLGHCQEVVHQQRTFEFQKVCCNDVRKAIMALSSNKSLGLDKLPSSSILSALCHIKGPSQTKVNFPLHSRLYVRTME